MFDVWGSDQAMSAQIKEIEAMEADQYGDRLNIHPPPFSDSLNSLQTSLGKFVWIFHHTVQLCDSANSRDSKLTDFPFLQSAD